MLNAVVPGICMLCDRQPCDVCVYPHIYRQEEQHKQKQREQSGLEEQGFG
jgi:predicted metal-binding protein